MTLKNQLTKTPYLVLFIVLISIGVGTASALITITLSGNVHITGDTTMDGTLGVGTDTPDAAFHVVGGGSDHTPNQEGIQLTGSDTSGNSGIELTTNDGTPYIDFQNDTLGTDYDARIILTGDDTLSIKGADLKISGDYTYATNQTKKMSFTGSSFITLDGDEAKRDINNLMDLQDISDIGGHAAAISHIYGVPEGAVLKEFSCRIWENDPDVSLFVTCKIYKIYSSNFLTMATLTNTTQTVLAQKFSADVSPNQVFDYSFPFSYVVYVSFDPIETANCSPGDCKIIHAEIAYEVSKVD